MNGTTADGKKYVRDLVDAIHHQPDISRNQAGVLLDVDVVIAPSSTALAAVARELGLYRERYEKLQPTIFAAAQKMHWERSGPFPGEISAAQISEAGGTYVIIGRSERWPDLGEIDQSVNLKTIAAIEAGLTPIVCVGETVLQRAGSNFLKVIERQLTAGLADLAEARIRKVVIAYEPVGAVGTNLTAKPEQADKVHAFIRGIVWGKWGNDIAQSLRILYSGSVKPENIDSLMAMPNFDGVLVGRASLKVNDFAKIIRFGLPE